MHGMSMFDTEVLSRLKRSPTDEASGPLSGDKGGVSLNKGGGSGQKEGTAYTAANWAGQ